MSDRVGGGGVNERELLEHYRPWIRTTARRALNGRPGVDDLSQEMWVAMWRGMAHTEGPAPLDWWLKRQAVLRMKQCLRDWHDPAKQRQHMYVDDVAAVVDLPAELAALELAYHEGQILTAINRLSPAEREYVFLRFYAVSSESRFNPLLSQRFGGSRAAFELWRTARPKLAAELAHLERTH